MPHWYGHTYKYHIQWLQVVHQHGQNLFHFSYYGLFSPIILLSYLFPKLPMTVYVSLVSMILAIVSGILCYLSHLLNEFIGKCNRHFFKNYVVKTKKILNIEIIKKIIRKFIRFSNERFHKQVLTAATLVFIILLTHGKYLFGSNVDWVNQHSVLPE